MSRATSKLARRAWVERTRARWNALSRTPVPLAGEPMKRSFACPMLPAVLLACLLSADAARADLVALDIQRREPFADGQAFGDVGPYEKLTGVARFAVDPKHPL